MTDTSIAPVVQAEVVDVISPADAKRLDKRIRLLVQSISDSWTKLHELVELAKQGQIHQALGYRSWPEYVADVFTMQARLDRDQRRELVGYLSGEGMSQRAVAEIVGVDHKTVGNDLRTSVGENSPTEPADPARAGEAHAGVEGSIANVAEQQQTTGRDGKSYRRKPRPADACPDCGEQRPSWLGASHKCQPKPRRKPIINEATALALELGKVNKRVERLANDDRFSQQRDAIGCRMRPQVAHSAQLLAQLHQEITPAASPLSALTTLAETVQACVMAASVIDVSAVDKPVVVQSIAAIRDCLDGLHDRIEQWEADQ